MVRKHTLCFLYVQGTLGMQRTPSVFYLAWQPPCNWLVWRTHRMWPCVVLPQETSSGRKAAQVSVILIILQSFSKTQGETSTASSFKDALLPWNAAAQLAWWTPQRLEGPDRNPQEERRRDRDFNQFLPRTPSPSGCCQGFSPFTLGKEESSFCCLSKLPLAPAALSFVREKAQTVFYCIVAMSPKLGTKVLERGPCYGIGSCGKDLGALLVCPGCCSNLI